MMLWPNGTRQRPVVSSPFGPRSGGAFSYHYGADLVGYSTVRAAGAGKVTFAGWLNNAAGNTVYISYGGGVTEIHMHLASFAVSKGARVNPGDPIGQMGRTGNASGNCDHFEIRVNGVSVDPLAYTAARLDGVPAGGGTSVPKPTPAPPTPKEEEIMVNIPPLIKQADSDNIWALNDRSRKYLLTPVQMDVYRALAKKRGLNINDFIAEGVKLSEIPNA